MLLGVGVGRGVGGRREALGLRVGLWGGGRGVFGGLVGEVGVLVVGGWAAAVAVGGGYWCGGRACGPAGALEDS